MSQGGKKRSPFQRGKSPSRIPVLNSASGSRKRAAPASDPEIIDLADEDDDVTHDIRPTPKSKPVGNALRGFKRLEAMAKADARTRDNLTKQTVASKGGVPWVEKHLPKSLDELFVHKAKVGEVMLWMNVTLSEKRKGKILVVNGPAGCGKTATVYLAADKLEADVKEWTNPMNLTQYKQFGNTEDFRDEVQGRSQLDLFTDFLFRTSQYRSLPMKGKTVKDRRIIMIEDIPNIFYRDTSVFHGVLRKYAACGQTPLVFIFTDSAASEHSMYKMFPATLLKEIGIQTISMNPVAPTLMVKFLLEICKNESIPVDKTQVEEVAATANGDLRCAVNNLQFSLTRERFSSTPAFRKPANKKTKGKNNAGASKTSAVQQKDDTIQLFRALGKVLYAKRDETTVAEVELELEGEMEKERRLHPLIENPEAICNRMEASADTFLKFLHQNYPTFYTSMDDMKTAAEYLSDSDFIMSGWKFDDSGCKQYKAREVKDQVAMSTTIRGLMHSNSQHRPHGFKPLVKPIISNLDNTIKDNVESTRQALFHLRELQNTLFTEAIPFYAKLLQTKPSAYQTSGLNVGAKEIIDKGLFQQKPVQFGRRLLDEKEVVEEESNETVDLEAADPQAQNGNTNSASERKTTDLKTSIPSDDTGDDEEFIIEDFE